MAKFRKRPIVVEANLVIAPMDVQTPEGVMASSVAVNTVHSAGIQDAAVIDGTNTQFVGLNAGMVAVVAGDLLDIRVTSSGSAPSGTADYTAEIVLE